MKLVLDTHVWIWSLTAPDIIKETARDAIRNSDSIAVSAVSVYEVDFKVRLGRWTALDLDAVDDLLDESDSIGIDIVPLDRRILSHAARLDWPHGDPFDRMIVATARNRHATVVTADRQVIAQSFVDVLEA